MLVSRRKRGNGLRDMWGLPPTVRHSDTDGQPNDGKPDGKPDGQPDGQPDDSPHYDPNYCCNYCSN